MGAVTKVEGLKDADKVCYALDRILLENNHKIYHSMNEAKEEMAAYKCFLVPGVKAVQVMENLITVQKEISGDWMDMMPAIKRVLNTHFEKLDADQKQTAKK